MTSPLSQLTTSTSISSWNSTIARQAHTQSLSQAVHGVSSKQTSAGATARAGSSLNGGHISLGNLASSKFTSSLKGLANADIMSLITAWQHRAAADNHTWNVQTGSSHQHTRYNLIAVWNEHQSIKASSSSYSLNGICNKLTAGQRELHAGMAHSNTIANANSRELHRSTASSSYT